MTYLPEQAGQLQFRYQPREGDAANGDWQLFGEMQTFAVKGPKRETQLIENIGRINNARTVELRQPSFSLVTLTETDFLSGVYQLSENFKSNLGHKAQILKSFNGLPLIKIVASTDDQSISDSLEAELYGLLNDLQADDASATDRKLFTILERALAEWNTGPSRIIAGQAPKYKEQSHPLGLVDNLNQQLAQARALSVLRELLRQQVIDDQDLQSMIDSFAHDEDVNELILSAQDSSSPVSLYLLPENAPGNVNVAKQKHRFVQLEFITDHSNPTELLISEPGSACEPNLYVYELGFAAEDEVAGVFDFNLNQLLAYADLNGSAATEMLSSAADLLGLEIHGGLDARWDVDGRIVFGFDTRASALDDFIYVDTSGLGALPSPWPDGDTSHSFSVELGSNSALSSPSAEVTALGQVRLTQLEMVSSLLENQNNDGIYAINNPDQVLNLLLGAALDLTPDNGEDGLISLNELKTQANSGNGLNIEAGVRLDADIRLQPILDQLSAMGTDLGGELKSQIDDLIDIELPSVEELSCWRTLLPSIAELIDSVAGKFDQAGTLVDRLPSALSGADTVVSELASIGTGMRSVSDALLDFQASYLNEDNLVSTVNDLFSSYEIPFELNLTSEAEGAETENTYTLAPTQALSVQQTFSLDADDLFDLLRQRGAQSIDIFADILDLAVGELSADFVFDIDHAGSFVIKESCADGVRMVNSNPELDGFYDLRPDAFAFGAQEQDPLADYELALLSGFILEDITFSSPLIRDDDGSEKVYKLLDFEQADDQGVPPTDARETFSVALGLAVQTFDDQRSKDEIKLTKALNEGLDAEADFKINFNENALLDMGEQIAEDAYATGQAWANEFSDVLDQISSLELPEPGCSDGWFSFINNFVDLVTSLSDQLASKLDLLENQASALPSWVPTGWLAEASNQADRFKAMSDEVNDFRDQWLTAEGFVGNINDVFERNDLDIHLKILAQPANDIDQCCDDESDPAKPQIFLTKNNDFRVDSEDSYINLKDRSEFEVEPEDFGTNIRLERFSNVEANGEKRWVLKLAEANFGYAGGIFKAEILDPDDSLTLRSGGNNLEGSDVWLQWEPERTGYALFADQQGNNRLNAVIDSPDKTISLKVSAADLDLRVD
ncbi:MAG: hypothetical protein AB8B36_13280, partial [Prochlorococcus sp.]